MPLIVLLIVLNLRGVKESVKFLLPIFLVFLVTHVVLIGGSLLLNVAPRRSRWPRQVADEVRAGLDQSRVSACSGMLSLLLYAYSLGAGTYTGIEAVSNSMPVMREPRVATAKRTMRLHGHLAGAHGRRPDAGLSAAGHPAHGKARR